MPGVALIDSGVHPVADEFYRRCPDEVVGATGIMHVARRVLIPGMTLESLLTHMSTLGAGDEVLIVQHGTPQGLSMWLIPGEAPLVPAHGRQQAQYVLSTAEAMAVILATADAAPMSDTDAASRLGLDAPRVSSLRASMRRVQGLRFAHVALRACNIGQNPSNMQTIKQFFGATGVSAPDQPDAYGTASAGTPTTSAAAWSAWRRAHAHRFEYPAGPLGGTFAVSPNQRRVAIAMMADSWTVVERWVGSHLPAGAYQGANSPFIWHALWWGLPPTFSGEPGYRTHIVTV